MYVFTKAKLTSEIITFENEIFSICSGKNFMSSKNTRKGICDMTKFILDNKRRIDGTNNK